MKKLSLDDFIKLRKLVYRSARPLEFTMWKCVFENGSAEDFFGVLSAYQNEDGGFGHNIEAKIHHLILSEHGGNYWLCVIYSWHSSGVIV